MFCVLLIVVTGLIFYCFLYKPQLFWREKNVKQGPPIPILGDNYKVFFRQESLHDMIKRNYGRFKNTRYMGIYMATQPMLILRDPELIKQLTVKDFDHFTDHLSFTPENADPLWKRNLFSLKGDVWREMRSTLSPTFTSSKMRSMFTLMEKSAQQYVNFYLEKNADVVELEMKDSLTRFANDVIGNCAFGVTVDSLKDPENAFYMKGKDISTFTFWKNVKLLLHTLAPKFTNYFKLSMFSSELTEFFQTLIRDTVRVREEQNIVRHDVINLLMEARKGRLHYEESTHKDAGFAAVDESEVGKKKRLRGIAMSENDMAAQVLMFFVAGFETISTMMTFLSYELAVNPDVQEKHRQEIDDTYIESKGKLTYDILNKMKYLDMVVSKSLRKWPPVNGIDRVCTKPYTIQPVRSDESLVQLDIGNTFLLPIVAIQNDEEYYSNPDKFDPERFSEENKANITPYTFIPFGSGLRNCIGSRFALMEIKILIFHMLSKFEILVTKRTLIPAVLANDQLNPAMKGGCWLGYKRRAILV